MPRARLIFLCMLLPVIAIIFVYSFLVAYYNDSSLPVASLPNYLHLAPGFVLTKGVLNNSSNSSTIEPGHERRSPSDELTEYDLNSSTNFISLVNDHLIDVVEDFPNLKHRPSNTSFWTSELENRYQNNETLFPLKVCFSFFLHFKAHLEN